MLNKALLVTRVIPVCEKPHVLRGDMYLIQCFFILIFLINSFTEVLGN